MQNNKLDSNFSFGEYCLEKGVSPIKQDVAILPTKKTTKQLAHIVNSITHSEPDIYRKFESNAEYCTDGQKYIFKFLRQDKYKILGSIDLHGYTQVQALARLEQFIAAHDTPGNTCLKIIHGKGNNSENNQSILKASVRNYLEHHPRLLAYTSGSYEQGGDGITLVKLKHSKRR